MPLAGLVLNRVHPQLTGLAASGRLAAAEQLDAPAELAQPNPQHSLAGGLLRLHAERVGAQPRGRRSWPTASSRATRACRCPAAALAEDVHDLAGLRMVTAGADGAVG